jgi:membrane fusion protein (multidrug efflux system)
MPIDRPSGAWDHANVPSIASPAVAGALLLIGLTLGCKQADVAPPPSEAIQNPGAGAIRVEAASARLAVLEAQVIVTGMTAPWRDANLRAEAGGRVLEVTVDNGDTVAAGDLLLRIDGSRQRLAVSGASARVEALEHDIELARTDYERKQGLVAKGSLPAAQLDAARHALERAEAAFDGAQAELGSARRSSKDARLEAPIDGLVTRRLVDVGDTLGPGAPLLDVVDLSKIRIHVGLAGSEIARLDEQAEARVTIEDLGGDPVPARFSALAPAADPVTGLFDVEYQLDNPDAKIRGGMVATVDLPLRAGVQRVLIPRAALTRRSGRLSVFVLESVPVPGSASESGSEPESGETGFERRTATLREVRVGAYGDSDVEILAGIQPGEIVAISAQHALADAVVVEFERQLETR